MGSPGPPADPGGAGRLRGPGAGRRRSGAGERPSGAAAGAV